MDEDVIDVEQLIECVGLKPCIWNRSLPEHHTRSILSGAWRSVAAQMNAQFGDMSLKEKETYCKLLQKKWRNIRDQWAKSCKKVADQKKAGTPARHIKHYVYHDQLRFLQNNSETDCDAQENNNSQHSDTSDSKDLDAGNNNKHLYSHRQTSEDPKEQQWKKQKLNNDTNPVKWNTSLTEHDPKLYFFKSILPSIEDFSVDEMLEFQSGIIDLIKGIKVNRYYQPPLENDCGTKVCSPSDNWDTTNYQKNLATPRDSPARSELSIQSSSGSENNDSSSRQQSDTSSSKDDRDSGNKDKGILLQKPSNKVSRRPTVDEIEKRDDSAVSDCFPNEPRSQTEFLKGHSARYRRFQRGSDIDNAARKSKPLSKKSK